jgi:glycosyltransferase involved in cell wall biosynthesis
MNVLHLSTHEQRGGAAKSAWRLHQGLLSIGVNSSVLEREDAALGAWHETIATPWFQSLLPPGSSWFTTGSMDANVHQHPLVQQADILHLHWVAEWLSVRDIVNLAALGKPIFWTFHDLWAVSCGNHYAGANEPLNDNWETGQNLPEILRSLARREYERKLQHLAPLPIHVIAPSQWIGKMCQQSQIGAQWQVSVVPYGIDTSIFKPQDRTGARAALGLSPDKTLLLFGAAALADPRKGFSHLCSALPASAEAELVLFGADKPDASALHMPLRHMGQLSDEQQIATLYAAADAYLCPTLEDNLPNTVIESLCCGTPVIGYATGGLPDMVIPGKNGLLAPTGDVSQLAEHLTRFLQDAALRQTLHQFEESRYHLDIQPRAIASLYAVAHRQSLSLAAVEDQDTSWFPNAALHAVNSAAQRHEKTHEKLVQTKTKLQRNQAK